MAGDEYVEPIATVGVAFTSASSCAIAAPSAIFTKLRVAGRAEAIIRARDAGLGRS